MAISAMDALMQAIAVANTYTDETVLGGGAIKGKNCTILDVVPVATGNKITFQWTLDDGTVKTTDVVVTDGTVEFDNLTPEQKASLKGEKGDKGDPGEDGEKGLGIKSVVAVEKPDGYYHLIITFDDDTTHDAGKIVVQEGGASAMSDLTDVDLEGLSDGKILVYDAEQEKWIVGDKGDGGDASLETDVTSNIAVGAIASGTTLPEGTTFTEFAQKLLISEIAPTIGFSISKSGNVVYGGSYTETLTVNVSNMGTAKKIKSIAWYEGNTLKQTDTIDSSTTGSWSYTMGTATTDSTTFKAIITYTKSDDNDATSTKTASINFYYNKFYGAVADLDPSEATVEALTTALGTGKGGTYSFTVTAGRICYAYPKSLGALTSIKDGNGFSLFDSFTRTEQTYTQNGTSVAYYRYVLTDSTTVSAYNVTFA